MQLRRPRFGQATLAHADGGGVARLNQIGWPVRRVDLAPCRTAMTGKQGVDDAGPIRHDCLLWIKGAQSLQLRDPKLRHSSKLHDLLWRPWRRQRRHLQGA